MIDLIAFLSDFTIRNVAMGAALLGITSGVLGSFALLREQSLLGDTLSHAALPGICIGFLLSGSRQPIPILLGALFTGALAALVIQLLIRRSRLKTDAAMGIALSVFFAIGIVLLTFVQKLPNAAQAGLDSFLFGQAAAILPSDVAVMAVVTGITLLIVILLWKEFKLMTFDGQFSSTLGFPTLGLELVMTVMIALAIVIGLQMVGVILMAAIIIAPAAAARQWTSSLEMMVLLAALFGAASGVTGALISATARGLSTGPMIVIAASVVVIVSLLFAPNRGLIWELLATRRHHADLRTQQVLVSLYKLAKQHDDPTYPSELGMINSYYGQNTRKLMKELEHDGLVTSVEHMREEGQHWALTKLGYDKAQSIQLSLVGEKRHDALY